MSATTRLAAEVVPTDPQDAGSLLRVRDLSVTFGRGERSVHAVRGISYDVAAGETLGIVGESGCGKSVSSLALMRLLPKPAGRIGEATSIQLDGRDLTRISDREMRDIRGEEIAMIFQDPMSSLNPVLTIERQLTEVLEVHRKIRHGEAVDRAVALLETVGIPRARERIKDYPHQFSGGMRQRVMIAMALACEPKLLIADEPTTALDVTIQAQILELLRSLVSELDTALIMITHDLGVVAGMCERVNVMYAGLIVETGPATRLFAQPRHPYTLGLLQSVPRIDAGRRQALQPIPGTPPNMLNAPAACPFAPRCG